MKWQLPQFPFGGVYYRKANPAPEDWERDYQQARNDGFNTFRHWFMWSAIQIAPDRFYWDDYDRQLDLAAKYGMKTIIAEITHAAPEWAYHLYPHCRQIDASGHPVRSHISNSSCTGGFGGLCLDNDDALELATAWLTELVRRYKGHPALGGYDVWNECNLQSTGGWKCHCPATLHQFREWLRNKYGDIRTLAEAWRRHSLTSWDQVEPSPTKGPYPDYIDYVAFRYDNAYRKLQWRIDTIKSIDPDVPVVGHGVAMCTLSRRVDAVDDAWKAASMLDGYGYSGAGVNGGSGWGRICCADLARSAAAGKPVWAAELTAGIWGWHIRRGSRRDRIPTGEDLRRAQFMAMAGGVKGIFSNRMRPQIDGPYWGKDAYYNLDGSPTDRSEMAGAIARWANDPAQAMLWQSNPVRGDIGILTVPEAQVLLTLQYPDETYYNDALRGAYNAFTETGIQADWVHLDQIEDYDLLYLPLAFAMSEETANKVAAWVHRGGKLIADGCPGYFDDKGRAGTVQPNLGLDRLFGAREVYMEIAPDILEDEEARICLELPGVGKVHGRCGFLLQAFREDGGKAVGWYDDGRIAAIEHKYGKGTGLLLGTVPGWAYHSKKSEEQELFMASFLTWAGKQQHVRSNCRRLLARLHDGVGGTYLWLVNDDMNATAEAEVILSDKFGPFHTGEVLWGARPVSVAGRTVKAVVPPLDAVVVRLE